MKRYIISFSLIVLSVIIFAAGFIFYKNYTDTSQVSIAAPAAYRASEDSAAPVKLPEEEQISSAPAEAALPIAPLVSSGDEVPAAPAEKTGENKIDAAKIKSDADCPGDIINLTNWKQTLPTGNAKKPAEIKQPELASFSANPYFKINSAKNGVICRAPVNGVTTSNSGYPRSELREMVNGGKDLASWSTTSGTHTMFIDEAITAVPKNKKHVVAGQIHDADDDVVVIRLEYPKLFVDINGKTGPTLDAAYVLGKRFTVKFVASNGEIKIYYNGSQSPVFTMAKKTSGCYFKAGAYTQSNCSKESDCSDKNFGEVIIYDLSVSH